MEGQYSASSGGKTPDLCDRTDGDFDTLMEAVPVAVLVSRDRACRRIRGNRLACALFRIPPGGNLSLSGPNDECPRHYRICSQGRPLEPDELPMQRSAREARTFESMPLEVHFEDESVLHVLVNSVPLRDAEGSVCGAIAAMVDVSEHVDSQRRLRELTETLESRVQQRTGELVHQSQQLRALALQLTEAEHAERMRIAQVLHDRFQQLLVGAKFKLGLVGDLASEPAVEDLVEQIDEIIDESLETTRTLSMELSSPVLYEGGLVSATRWLAERFAQYQGLQVEVEAGTSDGLVQLKTRVLLFDCIQELLLNIVKHAHVEAARVSLQAEDGSTIRIRVQDAGRGFDPAAVETRMGRSCFGLFHLTQRVESIGGRIEVESTPGQGTTVTIIAPVRDVTSGAEAVRLGIPLPQGGGTRSAGVGLFITGGSEVERVAMARLLREQGDLAVVAQEPALQEAFERVDALEPDVLLVLAADADDLERAGRLAGDHLPTRTVLLLGEDIPDAEPAPGLTILPPDCSEELLCRTLRQAQRE